MMQESKLKQYLQECKTLIITEINTIIPNNQYRPILYDLVLDYPLRGGKAFRPSLCIATCRALGGRIEDVLSTAAVLELYHNAFLVHDDIEDRSLVRRGKPTLHLEYGVPIAINVGDSIFALCLQPLLDNTRILGLGKALNILQIIAEMARESVEGQAMELDWIRREQWNLNDQDYYTMCYKKSCWYTFIAPTQIGGIISGASPALLNTLWNYSKNIGIAFQIQDDILNLVADEERYGKEIGGDLWEGKHTLIIMHMMRNAAPQEIDKARHILMKDRSEKTDDDIKYLFKLIDRYESIAYAREKSLGFAEKADQQIKMADDWLPASVHRDFLVGMVDYVTSRDH
jgi:geranylgeranyl diphosphate synthase type II